MRCPRCRGQLRRGLVVTLEGDVEAYKCERACGYSARYVPPEDIPNGGFDTDDGNDGWEDE